jgi:hypothetical protein
MYERLIFKAFQKMVADTSANLKKGDLQAAIVSAMLMDSKPMKQAYNKIDREVFRDAAERNYRRILKQSGYKSGGFGSYSLAWLSFLEDYLTERATEQLVRAITRTTEKKIIRLVQQAINDGIGSEDLARQIEKGNELDRLNFRSLRQRSRTIARTERTRAANAAHRAAADNTPFEVDLIWNSAQNDRTRGSKPTDEADHLDMDRQVAVNGLFTDPRNGDVMGYPGDISMGAGPASTINCRCVLTELARRDANGRLVMKNPL